jgi:hypothetical protein
VSNIDRQRKALIARVLDGDGKSSSQQRNAAFWNQEVAENVRSLIEKIAKHAYNVTDEDITAAKAAGFTEDQIYELTVCAALGQANRQYESALAALAAATKDHAGRRQDGARRRRDEATDRRRARGVLLLQRDRSTRRYLRILRART